ncbi:MAG: hypothetical protein ACRC6M_09060 [Microcystaceae cyanobacterium]
MSSPPLSKEPKIKQILWQVYAYGTVTLILISMIFGILSLYCQELLCQLKLFCYRRELGLRQVWFSIFSSRNGETKKLFTR